MWNHICIYIHHLHIENLKMMGFIPKMVTIRVAKFMLGLGGGVFFTIFWHLGGEDPIFTFSHHSAFEFCIGETELRVAKPPLLIPRKKTLFESNIYHLFKSTQLRCLNLWTWHTIPYHPCMVYFPTFTMIFSSPNVSWPLNTDPCYRGLNPSIGGSNDP